jgi:D-alanyl-D-alanine carboxypeptidase
MTVEEYLASKFRELKVPGLACSISYRGKISDYSFGKGDLELDVPLNRESLFNVASVAKLITVVSVFKLIETNKLNLRTNIGQLLPDLPRNWKAIRIDQLLTHSSGIKNYTDPAEYWAECQLDVSRSRILEYVAHADLEFEPGTRWKYSNTGYYLLGLIVEKLSGKDYFDFCKELFDSYKPGLTILPTDDRIEIPGRVYGYTQKDGEIVKTPYYSNSGTFAAGGFSVVLHDFIDFESAIFAGKVLNNESLNEITHPHLKDDGHYLKSPDPAFDFSMTKGLFRFENSGKPFLAHRGEIFGFTAEYRRMIKDDFSIIVATNADWEFESAVIIDEVYRLISSLN